ncbi:precorrin-2 C(20)-methyltransferase [Amylibacter sp. IMCC11727]|uniref:precorrin-2 C(20)-methyltransferase n=1 Tax=Amylibacter sp. IMCC11727 TaxID=3039851 RepID=UPI00244E4F2E|nr:precorrin-2 C(20)-methyltransferase [Amylibacter sp. IMCC11727]WGI21616.1 precorrin-2 C(20)-methyltransferase [Amylibacter sp. IMCC11727]
MNGMVYGVGLGPGDPELMTLKAARLIGGADVIAYPSLEGGDSFARAIAADLIEDGTEEIVISIPMSVERAPAQAAYDAGAAAIAVQLEAGKDVVVLCEGDPFFYGSFMYLFSRLSDRFECEVVPGVTSVTACAAALQSPLTARNEVLTIIPGPMDEDAMEARIAAAEAVAVMKVGRHLPKIKRVLERLGLMDHAGYVERASLPQEVVLPLSEAPEKAPYFSMILVTKGDDPWL